MCCAITKHNNIISKQYFLLISGVSICLTQDSPTRGGGFDAAPFEPMRVQVKFEVTLSVGVTETVADCPANKKDGRFERMADAERVWEKKRVCVYA